MNMQTYVYIYGYNTDMRLSKDQIARMLAIAWTAVYLWTAWGGLR